MFFLFIIVKRFPGPKLTVHTPVGLVLKDCRGERVAIAQTFKKRNVCLASGITTTIMTKTYFEIHNLHFRGAIFTENKSFYIHIIYTVQI